MPQQRQQYQQPRAPQPPRRRKPNRGLRIFAWGAAGLLAVLVLLAVIGSRSGTPTAAASSPAASPSAEPTAAEAACTARKPAYGDILVRDDDPGASVMAQELGGGYVWDHVTGICLDAVEWAAATAGRGPGECTTIALASDNPGYDANAVPAPRLKHVIRSAGPGC